MESIRSRFKNVAIGISQVIFLTWIALVLSGCVMAGSISFLNNETDIPPTLAVSYTNPSTYYVKGSAITFLIPAVSGSPVSLSISPTLPSGLSFDSTTGIISGIPTTALAPTTYTVTAHGSDGTTATASLSLEVAIPFTVDTTTDASDQTPGDEICATSGGQCSVRAALEEGAALSGVLSLISVPAGTYTLSSTITVNSRVELTGGGAGAVFSGGNAISPVVIINNFPVTMDNFTVSNGRHTATTAATGVGIRSSSENLVLRNCEISNNSVSMNTSYPRADGVGLYAITSSVSTGTILIDSCDILSNTVVMGTSATGGQSAGIGGLLRANSVTIRNSLIQANSGTGGPNSGFYQVAGAGLLVNTNDALFEAMTLDANVATSNPDWDTGGGLYLLGAGSVSIEDLVCTNNQASRNAGCMYLATTATTSIVRAHVEANRDYSGNGGGIALEGSSSGPVTIVDSYFDSGAHFSNQLHTGFSHAGEVRVQNSTFYSDSGSPIYLNANGGTTRFENCTFITGDGYAFQMSGSTGLETYIKNSIFEVRAGGTGDACMVALADITSEGYNIARGTTCGFLNAGLGDLQNTDPQISVPALNGGTTKTAALAPTSPAIDAIPLASCSLTTDQQGVARPRGAGCDIGAFEL